MLFDPRFATGPNATALSLPTDEKPISTRKDRKGAQDIPGVNKVPPGQGSRQNQEQSEKILTKLFRQRMGAKAASSRISGSCKAREEKSKGR